MSRIRENLEVEDTITREVNEVVGPLSVLAAPHYDTDMDSWVLIGTLPTGLTAVIEELVRFKDSDGRFISILEHLRHGDVIVCADAIRGVGLGERWYYTEGCVYQLVAGKTIDLAVRALGERSEESSEETAEPPLCVQ
jgi:hypothetical protein